MFFSLFLYIHLSSFFLYREWTLALFAFSETITIFLFVFRKPAVRVSTTPFDYLLAATGTLAGLLFRPAEGGFLLVSAGVVSIGVIVQCLALLSLNTSFGIVPADRGVKTSGLYAYIRHPMYMSYIFMYSGYCLANPSIINILILFFAFGVQVWRMIAEEKILFMNPQYLQYSQQVKWRLLPRLF